MKRLTWMILASMLAACASTAPGLPSSSAVEDTSPPASPITGVLQQPSIKGNEHFVWCASCPDLTPKIVDTSDIEQKKDSSSSAPGENSAIILFGYDRYRTSLDRIARLASLIHHISDGDTLEISGYTDAAGSSAYNQHLARRRATYVRDWISTHTNHHITYRISAHGKCCYAHQPGLSPENRRVEVSINKKEKIK